MTVPYTTENALKIGSKVPYQMFSYFLKVKYDNHGYCLNLCYSAC